ncbi:HIT family protein [Brachybacterium hainanense]|uniref:HIT family protein n=1 Tax=Brachybacterium hainanense TaxID=1541174 RepID=A0ABV6RAQ5_9MICO
MTWREDRVGAALAGTNPTVLAELDAAFAVIGDVQFLPGYTLALTRTPGADRLTDLPRAERLQYLSDVELIAAAVEAVCAGRDPAFRRVNIEILGNADAFLHAHIWPRYDWEPAELVRRPVWLYPRERWADPAQMLGPRHEDVRCSLAAEIGRLSGRDERGPSDAPTRRPADGPADPASRAPAPHGS